MRDLKEFFHVYPWSVFPSEVSGAALRYAEIATELAKTLLGWVEANTPADVAARFSQPLASMIDGSRRTLLRVLRYPPLDGAEAEGAVRAAAHEDINLLTVLPAANEPGLELLDAEGRWFAVPCDPGSVAVNGGEMLDLASGGYYPATTHRVVNPIGEAATRAAHVAAVVPPPRRRRRSWRTVGRRRRSSPNGSASSAAVAEMTGSLHVRTARPLRTSEPEVRSISCFRSPPSAGPAINPPA